MGNTMLRGGFALILGLLGSLWTITPASASAAEFPYIFEPELTLTGDCSTPPPDTNPDPGCPYPPPPAGPSGRFHEPWSVTSDAYGNEYVASYAGGGAQGRIDLFNNEGLFITEIADPNSPMDIAVDDKGNLYVLEQSIGRRIVRFTPSVYKPEVDEIEYGVPPVTLTIQGEIKNGLAVDPSNGHLFVAQQKSITEYGSADEGNKLLNTISSPKLESNVRVAVDGLRQRLFASYCRKGVFDCGVLVFEAKSPYGLLKEIDGSTTPQEKFFSTGGWLSIAVDEASGHFFVDDLEATNRILEFGEEYEYISTLEDENFGGGNPLQIAVSNSPLNPTARNLHYLFVPVPIAAGRVLAFEPPAITEPEIKSLDTSNIGETEAELRAMIDPNGGNTEYAIEVEGPGIEGTEIVAQGTIPGSSLSKQVGGLVSGLEPGVTYNIRAFAENEAGDHEKETLFATFSDAPIFNSGSCPNQSHRDGTSAGLPDCRAYELATPANTNGLLTKGAGIEGDRFGTVQASPGGEALSFELMGGALPGTEGTGGIQGDPYKSTRSPGGWNTELVGPTGTESSQPLPGSFSPDQGFSFWVASGKGSAVVDGNEGRYVRYPDSHSELIGRGSLGTEPQAKGRLITENGTHIVFQTQNLNGAPGVRLEPNAPPTGTWTVYDRTPDEVTHVVSLLPGDVTPTEYSIYKGASADGEGIAFENEGTLYLRLNNATTLQIGNKGAAFAGVSDEGKRAFYLEGGDLKAFDTGEEKVIDFSEVGDAVPVNVAPDGGRAYFVSEEAIPSSGPNPNGDEPQSGEQNLYLSEEGAISFVATVTERDVGGVITLSGFHLDGLGLWTEALQKRQPADDPSRLTPDGSVLLFQSRANLDEYDSGGFPQIYRYDSSAEELECLSCPPTKTPASGGAALQSSFVLDLAAPSTPYGLVPNLRADGKRAFFESTEALVSSDTDEVRDVYEWEEEGVGSCKREGGCIYLISSGHSARANYLFGHSASGDDVFFTTGDVLVGGDEDTPSVYDARVGGGFGEPDPTPCFEEGCKPPQTPPPSFPQLNVPGTDSGNVTPQKPQKRCPRGKHRAKRNGKTVCIKNKRHKRHHRSGTKGN